MAAARTSTHRLVVLLVITSIAMIAADRQPSSPFTGARRSALSATEPVRSGLDRLASPALGAWEGARSYDEWLDENDRLRARVEELEGARDGAADTEAELQRLREATDLDHHGDLDTTTARVVVNRVSSAVRVIELDRGSTDGIRTGMPVVTGRGLVGLVEVAGPDRAIVRPLTAVNVRVGVRSGNEYGVAVGSGPDDPLVLTMDPRLGSTPELGARLVTSGLDRSLYPDNIPVGTVSRAGSGEVVVVPLVDLDRLGYVTVLRWRAA